MNATRGLVESIIAGEITRLCYGGAFEIVLWLPGGDTGHLYISTPFRVELDARSWSLDPAGPPHLMAPTLGLHRRSIRGIHVSSEGALSVSFEGVGGLYVQPARSPVSWQLDVAGTRLTCDGYGLLRSEDLGKHRGMHRGIDQ